MPLRTSHKRPTPKRTIGESSSSPLNHPLIRKNAHVVEIPPRRSAMPLKNLTPILQPVRFKSLLGDEGNWVYNFDQQSSVAQALTVTPVASPTSDTPRSPHEAYPALLAPWSPHIVRLLETSIAVVASRCMV
ncbi:hypothetical protein Gotur_007372 [Gossypium turneri]